MVPADVNAVLALAAAQNRRDGTSYPVPQVFDAQGKQIANAPIALVTIDEKGRVRQAHIFERTVEMCSFGDDAEALSVSLEAIGGVCYLLREKGYTSLHVLVPKAKRVRFRFLDHYAIRQWVRTNTIFRALKRIGFTRQDDRLAHFFREIGG